MRLSKMYTRQYIWTLLTFKYKSAYITVILIFDIKSFAIASFNQTVLQIYTKPCIANQNW